MKIHVPKYNNEKVNQIIELYNSGKTQKEIAEFLGTYNTTIRRILLKNDIIIRGNSEIQCRVRGNPFKEDYDYWVGLLATDGCITNNTTIILDLQKKDLDIMIKYKEYLENKVNINTTTHYTGIQSYRIGFSSAEGAKFLSSYGVVPRKSLVIKLEKPLSIDMLRGIIDGDGGYSLTNAKGCRMQICGGSLLFMEQIRDYLISLGFHPTLTSTVAGRINRIYLVNMFRNEELNKLFDLLYYDGVKYYLKRKYLKFGSLLGRLNNENHPNSGKPTPGNPELANNGGLLS